MGSRKLKEIVQSWRRDLVPLIERELALFRSGEPGTCEWCAGVRPREREGRMAPLRRPTRHRFRAVRASLSLKERRLRLTRPWGAGAHADVRAGAERSAYGPYLSLVAPDVLADTAIMELLSHYNGNGAVGGIRTTRAVVGIGSAVEANYNAEQLKKHRKKVR